MPVLIFISLVLGGLYTDCRLSKEKSCSCDKPAVQKPLVIKK